MTKFEEELLELLTKYKVEISVQLDYSYAGNSVESIDFDWSEDDNGIPVTHGLYIYKDAIDDKLFKQKLKEKYDQ